MLFCRKIVGLSDKTDRSLIGAFVGVKQKYKRKQKDFLDSSIYFSVGLRFPCLAYHSPWDTVVILDTQPNSLSYHLPQPTTALVLSDHSVAVTDRVEQLRKKFWSDLLKLNKHSAWKPKQNRVRSKYVLRN